jgi:hypothetical protein
VKELEAMGVRDAELHQLCEKLKSGSE